MLCKTGAEKKVGKTQRESLYPIPVSVTSYIFTQCDFIKVCPNYIVEPRILESDNAEKNALSFQVQ